MHFTSLLQGLNKYPRDTLPNDARTLLNTPKNSIITPMGSGLYSHYGLQKGLINQLKWLELRKIPRDFHLHLNIDGLPLSKSSTSQVWPILVKFVNYPGASLSPFLVGIVHGNNKPDNVNLYLESTISEYLELNNEGFVFENRKFKIYLKLFCADTVARNYVLCFPPHNSRCGKCQQTGETIKHRRVFLNDNSHLRTDENFRVGVPDHYANLISPLEGIGMSLTNQVPLDPMHLLDEGVGKSILNCY